MTKNTSDRLRNRPDGHLIAVIGDEDTVTGFLLAGVGQVDGASGTNFVVVDSKTSIEAIGEAFGTFTSREDVAILLINQHIANKIRHVVQKFKSPVPAIVEIPSKEHPYDPSKDSVLQRVRGMLGSA
uniref:V-type proton ATPase subunit F n=1 Tax=Compsopogon caeruleus TaxID=31354 RepID=A0A6T6C1E1_9RHOD|mmetsp:Transcript_16592/g.34013  ORF Transcript_16592/g.34013 Transcript_16592/m.34013 type:complete len:127 (+) Transcript_16592:165-545(+)